MTKIEEKLIGEIAKVKSEVRNRTVKYVVAALGLVAGLAWNDAIKAFIEYFFPQDQNSLRAKLVYAVVITIVVAVASFYLAQLERKEEKKVAEEIKKAK
jgi:cadmium resistance protein CadD (predicted permease)